MQTTSAPGTDFPRVLHIDYPKAILRLLENNFQNRGLTWESTESGVQGLHLGMVQSYNLILLGLREVGIDGLRILKGLSRAGVRTPIVLFMPPKELELRRVELSRFPNVLACLSKPLDMREVEKVMAFLKQPLTLSTADKAKLMEVLVRVERTVRAQA